MKGKRVGARMLVLLLTVLLAGSGMTGFAARSVAAEQPAIISYTDKLPEAYVLPSVSGGTKATSGPVQDKEAEFAALAPTVNMTFEELVGEISNTPKLVAYPTPDTFYIVVDVEHQVVLAYTKDKYGAYTVPVRYMMCSTGARKTPTPQGTFSAGTHKVRFGYFVNDHVYGQYWSQVNKRIYFHSLLYTKRKANSYTTSSYRNLGQRASHGCIRLFVPDARWIYYHIAPGTTIEIRKGDPDDAATAAIKAGLQKPPLPKSRPKLAKDTIPYTDNWDVHSYLDAYDRTVLA